MKIQVDTLYIRELVYEMLRDLECGRFIINSGACRGMLDAEKTAAMEALIKKLEEQ